MPVYKHPVYPDDHVKQTYGRNIRVFGDRVLIVKLPKDRLLHQSSSLIERPYTASRVSMLRNNYGQVLAIGDDVHEIKAGWIVKWGDYAGMDVRLEMHFDLTDKGSVTTGGPDKTPQDRDFVVLREKECELAFLLEEGELIPEVHE